MQLVWCVVIYQYIYFLYYPLADPGQKGPQGLVGLFDPRAAGVFMLFCWQFNRATCIPSRGTVYNHNLIWCFFSSLLAAAEASDQLQCSSSTSSDSRFIIFIKSNHINPVSVRRFCCRGLPLHLCVLWSVWGHKQSLLFLLRSSLLAPQMDYGPLCNM